MPEQSATNATVTLDADHRYWAEKKGRRWEVPGVTFLLEWKFGKNPWFKPGSSHRGSMVHRACTLDDQGILDQKTVAPELEGYLDAWRLFKLEKGLKIEQLEYICYDLTLGYAGTADRLVYWNYGPRPCVVDIKSGAKTDRHWLQVGGYVRGTPPELGFVWREVDGLIVYVKPNGKYTLDFYKGPRVLEAVRLWEKIPREYAARDSKIDWGEETGNGNQ